MIIQEDWTKKKTMEEAKAGAFEKAKEIMGGAERFLPRSKKGKNLSEGKNEKELDTLVSAILGKEKDDPVKKEQKKNEIRKKLYSIELVAYPKTVLFELVHLFNNTVLKLNVNHLFYKQVLQPLCGDLEESVEEQSTTQQLRRDIKDAVLLLLFAYARAESMFENNEHVYEDLRTQWAIVLNSALSVCENQK